MAFAVKRLPQILEDMLNWIIANQDKITDFNEGSIIRSFCEAIGIQIEELYIRVRLGFDIQLLNIPFNVFDFSIKTGEYASSTVVFTRNSSTGVTSIPIGVIVSTASGIQYKTTELGSIENGNTQSSAIDVIAAQEGSDWNVPSGAINTIITPIAYNVVSVTNNVAATGGQDQESSASYKQRFREFIEGLGGSNKQGIIAAVKKISTIRSASILEHFPPVSGYNFTLYVDDGSGNAPSEMITEAELVLNGDGSINYPGQKGGGINARVLGPTKVTIDVEVEIIDDGTISEAAVIYGVETAVTNYVNGLLIGEDVILNKISSEIIQQSGVTDCTISDPTTNTTISENQIARIGTITITFA